MEQLELNLRHPVRVIDEAPNYWRSLSASRRYFANPPPGATRPVIGIRRPSLPPLWAVLVKPEGRDS